MKFLCITCDEPMKLHEIGPPERGSLAVVYGCPTCGHRIALLTNPMETELVRSLGVRIGPAPAGAAAAGAAQSRSDGPAHAGAAATAAPGASPAIAPGAAERAAAGGCPFSGMVADLEAAARDGLTWTPEALARLDNIPDFVRPMARQGIEHYARSEGHTVIDEQVLAAARTRFGM